MGRGTCKLGPFVIFAAVLIAASSGALASSGGIINFSGQFGSDCTVCHSGGVVPTVLLTGPTTVAPGTVNTYTLTIQIPTSPTNQRAGGLGVSTDGGTLIATDAGTRFEAGQVVHSSPRTMNASREVIFSFDWEAPISAGNYTLYGAGNAVNLGQGNNGDNAAPTSLQINVSGATATPGEASGDTLPQMLVTGYDPISGEISITYGDACETTDNAIYSGPLNQVATPAYDNEDCNIGTGGSYGNFNPGADSVFFVIVGANGSDEGSYGKSRDAAGVETERTPFAANLCGQVQTLSDRCD